MVIVSFPFPPLDPTPYSLSKSSPLFPIYCYTHVHTGTCVDSAYVFLGLLITIFAQVFLVAIIIYKSFDCKC